MRAVEQRNPVKLAALDASPRRVVVNGFAIPVTCAISFTVTLGRSAITPNTGALL